MPDDRRLTHCGSRGAATRDPGGIQGRDIGEDSHAGQWLKNPRRKNKPPTASMSNVRVAQLSASLHCPLDGPQPPHNRYIITVLMFLPTGNCLN